MGETQKGLRKETWGMSKKCINSVVKPLSLHINCFK